MSAAFRLAVVSGGVRSGKSALAERLAREAGGDSVVYWATQAAADDEMRERVAAHRARRPAGWATVEAGPDDLPALRLPVGGALLVDCLGGFVAGALMAAEAGGEAAALAASRRAVDDLLATIRTFAGPTVVVTNEVGWGVVPPYPLGRWFRDALGVAGARLAAEADLVLLTALGLPLVLKGRWP